MKPQFLGIYFSLMIHGIVVILLIGISHGLSPVVKTVVLDFSLESGDGKGSGDSGKGGMPGGDDAQSQGDRPSSKASTSNSEVESSMDLPSTHLSSVSGPPPLIPAKRPPASAKPPPLPEEKWIAVQKPSPVDQVLQEDRPEILKKTIQPKHIKPKAVLRKKMVEPVPEQKATTNPPIQTAIKTSPPSQLDNRSEQAALLSPPLHEPAKNAHLPGRVPVAGSASIVDRFAESGTTRGRGMFEGAAEYPGPGLRADASNKGAGIGGPPRSGGGGAYLKAHFNFIRGRLREYLCYPNIARKRGWCGKVLVAFTIHPDGRAEDIEIQKSCGISLLDKSALKTVHNASPFPNPPVTARIVIPIVYQLN